MAETLIRLDKQTRAQTLVVGPNQTTDSDANVTVNTSGVTNDIAAAGALVIHGHTANPGTLTIKRGRTASDYTTTVFTAEGKVDSRGAGHFDGNLDTDGTLIVDGTSTLTGNVSAAGTLGVTGATTLSSTLAVTGASTLTGNVSASGTLGVTGAATLSSTLAVTGASTLTGNVSAGGTLGVTGATTLSSTLAVTGASTLTGNVSCGGTLAVTGASTLTGTATTGAILPAADSTHNIGSDAVRFATVYCDTLDATTLDATGLTISSTDADTFTINAETTPTNVAGDGSKVILKNYDDSTVRTAFLGCSNTGAVKLDGTNLASVTITPATTITGAATLSSTLAVTGASTLTGNTSVGGTLGVTGASTIAALSATTGTFSGTLHSTGNLDTNGTLIVDGASTLTGLITASAGMNISGADLAMSSKNITLGDSAASTDDRIIFGAGGDLHIYHSGTHSYVQNIAGAGDLVLLNADVDNNIVAKLGTDTTATAFVVADSIGLPDFRVLGNGALTSFVPTNTAAGFVVADKTKGQAVMGIGTETAQSGMALQSAGTGNVYFSFGNPNAGYDVVLSSAAAILENFGHASDGVLFTARGEGTSGNDIRVRFVDPSAANQSLSVSVSGTDITVNLATNGSSVITSTASTVVTAVNADATAKLLVLAAAEGAGTTALAAVAYTSLAGGNTASSFSGVTSTNGLLQVAADLQMDTQGANSLLSFGNSTVGLDTSLTGVVATLSDMGHATQGVDFTAASSGDMGGTAIRVRFRNTGASQSLAVSVSSKDISVVLATNGSSVITSTAQQVVDAINADASASALVIASLASTSATLDTASDTYSSLSGGLVNADVSGTLAVGGAATLSSTLAVTGASTLTGNVSAGGTLSVTGATTLSSTLGVTGAATLSSTLAVTSTSTLTGNVSCGGTLGVTGATTLSSTLAVTGNTTLTGTLTANGNTTLGSDNTDTVTFNAKLASNVIPNATTYEIGATGASLAKVFAAEVHGATTGAEPAVQYDGTNSQAGTTMGDSLDNLFNAANVSIQDFTGLTSATLTTTARITGEKTLVWKNGAMLRGNGNDFTNTSSTVITLASAPVESDVVVAMYFLA